MGSMSGEKLFGTDGIRGEVNIAPMTADIALRLGQAIGVTFNRGGAHPSVVIGKDTRLSGYMFENALTAGLTSVGVDARLVGPIPTPAIGVLTRSMRAEAGVMITASHNGYQDNGIKVFGPDGFKIGDAEQEALEAFIRNPDNIPLRNMVGRVRRYHDAIGRYVEVVKSSVPRDLSLSGMTIVVDSANGAGHRVAPQTLWELGAEVHSIGAEPNGININRGCGSTDLSALTAAVLERKADIGVAFDGDADRVIMVDEKGQAIDGDQILGGIASNWKRLETLRGGGVVATIMSNYGLERFLRDEGLLLHRTPVGDRHVIAQMRAQGFNVGGEQSGHVILSDYSTTGDGLIAAIQILAAFRKADRPASEALRVFQPVPQILRNVRFSTGNPMDDPEVQKSIADAELKLSNLGRVVVRKSGTEPLIRVMTEADDSDLAESVAASVVHAVETSVERGLAAAQ